MLQVGDVRLDPERHEVTIRDQSVQTAAEGVRAARAAAGQRRSGAARETLIDRVWGTDYVGDTKTLDVHVKRLRAKVEDDPSSPSRIITIRGLGYKYETPR